MIILIDDERSFITESADTIVFRTSAEALEWFKAADFEKEKIDEIWFDHDLGEVDGKPDTVMPIVDFIESEIFHGRKPNFGRVYVHSANPIGGGRVFNIMKKHYQSYRVFAGEFLVVH